MDPLRTDFRFMVPPLPPHHVSRPRLLHQLDGGTRDTATALVLVSAGAGAGKSALLTDWAERCATPVAWLALTPEDDDPRRFWRLFLESGRVCGQTYPPSAWADGHTVELLDSAFGRSPLPESKLTLVLDDAHVLTDPQILDGLDRIIRRWSHRVHLLMTSRSDPLLPLHRYRLAGQVRELRAADLAMTRPEVRELLDAHRIPLSDPDLATLTSRTEGWPAGLRLAALRMQNTRRPADFVALLATDQGSIGEYLTEEVLAQLPQPLARLLTETSFLDVITGPLADAVTGLTDSAAALARLARTNSFVVPLDAARTTFRYHQLLREVLRYLAAREPPEQLRLRYARAAAWYRGQGDLCSALRWTIRSRDWGATRSLLVRAGLAEAFVGRDDLAEAGLRALVEQPADGAPSPAEEEAARWAVSAALSDVGTAAGELRELSRRTPLPADADPDLRVTADLAEFMLAQKAADFPRLDRTADALLTDPGLTQAVDAVPGLRASVLLALARSRFSAGQLAEVQPLLQRALSQTEDGTIPAVQLDVLGVLAFVSISAGRPRRAREAVDRATALLAANIGLGRPVLLDLAIARRAELEADWATMGSAVHRVLEAGPVYADSGVAATVAYVQATYLIVSGDLTGARSQLRHNPALRGGGSVGPLAVLADVELAEIELLLGRPLAALRILQPHRRPPVDVLVAVVSAHAHLALGDLREAQDSVRRVLTTPSPFITLRTTVEALLCSALICDRSGEAAQAAELVERALLASDGEVALPFVRMADSFAPLLARHPTLAVRWPGSVSVPPAAATPGVVSAGTELADPLTSREQAVLRLMVTSLSTAEMADELALSVNTVKTHLAAIYRKLAVGRRREAVFRAREMELL